MENIYERETFPFKFSSNSDRDAAWNFHNGDIENVLHTYDRHNSSCFNTFYIYSMWSARAPVSVWTWIMNVLQKGKHGHAREKRTSRNDVINVNSKGISFPAALQPTPPFYPASSTLTPWNTLSHFLPVCLPPHPLNNFSLRFYRFFTFTVSRDTSLPCKFSQIQMAKGVNDVVKNVLGNRPKRFAVSRVLSSWQQNDIKWCR